MLGSDPKVGMVDTTLAMQAFQQFPNRAVTRLVYCLFGVNHFTTVNKRMLLPVGL